MVTGGPLCPNPPALAAPGVVEAGTAGASVVRAVPVLPWPANVAGVAAPCRGRTGSGVAAASSIAGGRPRPLPPPPRVPPPSGDPDGVPDVLAPVASRLAAMDRGWQALQSQLTRLRSALSEAHADEEDPFYVRTPGRRALRPLAA